MYIQEMRIGTDRVTRNDLTSWGLLRTKLKLPSDAKLPYVIVGDLRLANITVPITPEETAGMTLEV